MMVADHEPALLDLDIVPGIPDANGWITLASGEVASPAYSGPVDVYVGGEYGEHLNLIACHDHRPLAGRNRPPAQDPVFRREVVRVLREAAKLPAAGDFELRPATPDEQQAGDAVFASLYTAGRDVSDAVAELWGAVPGDGDEVQFAVLRVV